LDIAARGHPRSWPVTVGLLGAGWVAVTAVVVAWGWLLTEHLEGSLGAVDDDLTRWIAGQRTATLTALAEVAAYPGGTVVGAWVLLIVGLAVSALRRTWLPVLFAVVVEAGLLGIYFVATYADPRQRPPVRILDPGLVPDHSFPSGHTGTATAVFLVAAYLAWTYARPAHRWVMVLAVLPIACATARLYQGAHHLTDVLTSLVAASVWITLVARLVLSRDRSPA